MKRLCAVEWDAMGCNGIVWDEEASEPQYNYFLHSLMVLRNSKVEFREESMGMGKKGV